ncbi:cell division protein FtsX [Prevotella sp. OH937_COT-195]|uniref:cell division protein FtsX n=1 Tax=Prevotella sp. OH937_COT-195 TaxID=2491051 RepID=UPI000F64BC25|nr:permease-like cell division protein FtsX [Prevotella sp. OH937_COT-195]RRC97882.1 FtsX-like permease family protein [Prevotella sp. OH937_COT-195]
MVRKRNKSGRRGSLQVVTLCISTALVLVLVGLVVLSVLSARNLSLLVRENLVVTLVLSEDVTEPEVAQMRKSLERERYVRQIKYISKEQVLKEETKAMGVDPTEFIGHNFYTASLELNLKADYANRDSMAWIGVGLKKHQKVKEVDFQQDLMDQVNDNIGKASIVLIVLAVLLSIISFSLINNHVRLGVYSSRFNIHTMKLVGASWGFIRRPFIWRAIVIGVVAAIVAIAVLGGAVYAWYAQTPGILNVMTWEILAITGGTILLFGIIITTFCSYVSVNRFLRMKAGDLYKV